MIGFARKSLRNGLPAVAAFALVGPLVQAIQRALDPHPKGDPFVFPVLLLLPVAGVFLGAAALTDEREGGGLEFALALPLAGRELLVRLFAAGALPYALLAPILIAEAHLLGAAPATILGWGGPADLAALLLWPYVAGFLAALLVDRFATALALAFVLIAGAEIGLLVDSPPFAFRWLLLALYALAVADRLFAPPGLLEPRARAVRAAAGLAGFLLLALAYARPFTRF